MVLDHLDFNRILLPALMRYVRVNLIEDQVVLMLVINCVAANGASSEHCGSA